MDLYVFVQYMILAYFRTNGYSWRGALCLPQSMPCSVTAGDEFQSITRDLPSVPAVIQDLRVALRPLSLRIGVGLGGVDGRIRPPVNHLGGEAFLCARQAIESIK